jgi:hypothetical protein
MFFSIGVAFDTSSRPSSGGLRLFRRKAAHQPPSLPDPLLPDGSESVPQSRAS